MQVRDVEAGFLIKLARGERVMETLSAWCNTRGIRAGHLHGIGACQEIELAYYDLPSRTYKSKLFQGPLEVASMTGNIAIVADEYGEATPFIHAHGVFSDAEMQTVAGHIMEMTVAVTLEVFITPLKTELKRTYDDSIGLKLLDLPNEHV
jgi:predicted DNA-binding protein with PD1-like motif